MKILFRPQRGSLNTAMSELKEFDSVKTMLDYIVSNSEEMYGKAAFRINDLYIQYYGYDERIDWETYIVCTGRMFNNNYMERHNHPVAIGFMTFK